MGSVFSYCWGNFSRDNQWSYHQAWHLEIRHGWFISSDSQRPWWTWPWFPPPRSPASVISPSRASTGSEVRCRQSWTSRETTRSWSSPDSRISRCTRPGTRRWRPETSVTWITLESSTANPPGTRRSSKRSPWSTTLSEVGLDFVRPNIYLKLFPCQPIILPRLFTFNVTFVSKITDCTCVPQQILSRLILLWRPAWEIRSTSAWSWSTPKRETWPGSTTVSQEILNSSVRIFGSVETSSTHLFSFLCRKLLLHDSLDRHGQRHRRADGGGRENVQPRHLQCQLRGGQPPRRRLDEAHRQRFAGSQRSWR